MLNAQYCRDTLVHLLRRIAIMSEDQTMCSCDYRVCCEFFSIGLQVAMTTCTNPSSGVTIISTLSPSAKRGVERMTT